MNKSFFKAYGHYIYLYIFSCFVLSLCSHFSFFYKYNFSCDPSIYLTIGRGIIDGLIPYKDLLDIKGPIIFFLYAIFSPIKIGTNYFGIFILETIALWISITFIYKIIFLVSKSKKWSFFLTLIYPYVLFIQGAFLSGGEAEEFILPFVFILIYLTLKIIHNNFKTTKLQYLFLGFSIGFVFWIKYTCLGAWIAFYLCMIIISLTSKNFNELKKLINYTFIGFLIPTLLIIGYFITNHALSDLIWGYFGWNYVYGGSTHESFSMKLIFILCRSFSTFFKGNIIIWFLVVFGPYYTIFCTKLIKQNSAKIMLALMTFSSIALELIGGMMFPYYRLMAFPFSVITFCWLATIFKKIKINKWLMLISITLMSLIGVLINNPSIKQSKLTNYHSYQETFAKIITKKDNTPSILDFNEIDQGWYNYLGVLPPTKYFNKMNTHYDTEYKAFTKAQLNIIQNRKVKYVICPILKNKKENKFNKIVFQNYQIIKQQKINDGGNKKEVLLLERK